MCTSRASRSSRICPITSLISCVPGAVTPAESFAKFMKQVYICILGRCKLCAFVFLYIQLSTGQVRGIINITDTITKQKEIKD